MKNYGWFNFVKKTQEYATKLEECHHGYHFMRSFYNMKPSCIELNKEFEGMANSLAWYAELYNIKGFSEDTFLSKMQAFKVHKSEAEHQGVVTLLWLAGGVLSMLIGGTVPCMSYIACSSCYEKFTDKPYIAATSITVALISVGMGMVFRGSSILDNTSMSKDENLIDSYIEMAKLVDKFEYKPGEHLAAENDQGHVSVEL